VESSQSAPLLKLVDFGDARHIYDDSYIHQLRGSAEFAAPELIIGRPASLLSDIWSASLSYLSFVKIDSRLWNFRSHLQHNGRNLESLHTGR